MFVFTRPAKKKPRPDPAPNRSRTSHLENINLLCATELRGAAAHPACAAFGDAGARAAWAATLDAAGAQPWGAAAAAEWPNLHGGSARLLRQRDFGGIVRALFDAVKAAA